MSALSKQAMSNPKDIPLEDINLADPSLSPSGKLFGFYERLRDEDPVHYTKTSAVGPYWSVTRYEDIMYVDTHPEIFSSVGSAALNDHPEENQFITFVTMDPPDHGPRRKVVQPIVEPRNLANLEAHIRNKAASILDNLPIDQPFDWVPNVSIALTAYVLGELYDFPEEDRHLLVEWTDAMTAVPEIDGDRALSVEDRLAKMQEMAAYFARLWNERKGQEEKPELLSMLLHGEATKNMLEDNPQEFMSTVALLIIGGNDTTRNSISGGVVALNDFPQEYEKLRANPDLIPKMVPEIIRWHTPLLHMRRTVKVDEVELHGKKLKRGDKIAMWYLSGNRDPRAIDRPDDFIIDRDNPRKHLSFGFGIHRCLGNRLAEMQLRVLWEEIMKRFSFIEMLEEPVYVHSSMNRSIEKLMVRVHK